MTTCGETYDLGGIQVVEAYRLGKHDNCGKVEEARLLHQVVEAYRLGKHDNTIRNRLFSLQRVVEAYRLGKHDNVAAIDHCIHSRCCRSLPFG